MSMMSSGSRVSRLGDTMTGELGLESTGGAKHKLGFVAGQGIMRLLSDLGSVDVSAALRTAVTVNCKSNSGDGLFYRLTVGEACVFRNTGFAFEMLYAPSGAAGAVCTFTQTFQFSTTGIMTVGTVPLSRMRRVEVAASSAAAVTILVSTTQILTGVNLGTVNVGDRILVNAAVNATKGATAGQTLVAVEKESGIATISAYNGFSTIYEDRFHSASIMNRFSLSGIFVVTVGGTLVLRLVGDSAGSDSSVVSGFAQIRALVLNDG